jgi:hypothetical protein
VIVSEDRRLFYANWFVWAMQSLTKDEKRAHTAAWCALKVLSEGGSTDSAIQLARQKNGDRATQQLAAAEDPGVRGYAGWGWWATQTLGLTGDPAHHAAQAADAVVSRGGTSAQAALEAEKAAGIVGQHTAAEQAQVRRDQAFARAQAECPLPVIKEKTPLPGAIQLHDDEFLVTSAKDWGFSSQRIVMTTHRAIWTHGRVNLQQNSLYLTDIRDVVFRKPMIGYGSISFETSSGHVIEALPKVSNGVEIRNSLMALVHFARNRAQPPQNAAAAAPAPAIQPDKYEQLEKLSKLREQGILTEEEFQAEKRKVLDQ